MASLLKAQSVSSDPNQARLDQLLADLRTLFGGLPGAPGANGADGSNGAAGTVVTITDLLEGEGGCPGGGLLITAASVSHTICNPACKLYVSDNIGSSGNDGVSWAAPKKTIQQAIDSSTCFHTQIFVAKGSYRPINLSQPVVQVH